MLLKSQVKYIQSLGHKKLRDEEAVFIAEGSKIINELLYAPNVKPVNLFATSTWMNENRKPGPEFDASCLVEITPKELERISFQQSPQEVLGVFRKPVFGRANPIGKISLLLDRIQDPGNLGTIVRTADWFGIDLIYCSPGTADVFSTKTIQSTMGSIARVQVVYDSPELIMETYPTIPKLATVLEGRSIYSLQTFSEAMIMIGSEGGGLCEDWLRRSTDQITIPGKGNAESLNAAVAAGIIMAQVCRP